MSEPAPSGRHVDSVRAFNRFYTRRIGVLSEHLLEGALSLTETRVLYELAHGESCSAVDLGRDLGLDAGYLSRILRRFEKARLLTRRPSAADARQSLLTITRSGRAMLAPLEERARTEVAAMLGRRSSSEQGQVVQAMLTIEQLLGNAPAAPTTPFLLRPPRPGDMGWVVQQHGAIYAREWRYDQRFEALVARICADFLDHFDAARERCWIAERDGEIVGSVFLVKKSRTVAKLRLLLVDPRARGFGIGGKLVDECVRFARDAGYRTLTLWTQSELVAARRLYKQAGFVKVDAHKHDSFGRRNLIAETWELSLR
ncbi:MAG TPA: bifunctional helix-turn-helix transcriptional regulator/GNAT family N-acetyltransferase [Vicinamibacterales bacterium]|jgi:DNA-binding MarR family transcriptional regulator/GNAT superfamily N-acetyltransferase